MHVSNPSGLAATLHRICTTQSDLASVGGLSIRQDVSLSTIGLGSKLELAFFTESHRTMSQEYKTADLSATNIYAGLVSPQPFTLGPFSGNQPCELQRT